MNMEKTVGAILLQTQRRDLDYFVNKRQNPKKKIIIIFLRIFFSPVYEDKCLKKLFKSIKVESLNLPFFSIIVSFFFQTKVSYVCRLKVIYGTQFTCFTRSHRTSTTKMAGLKLHLST